MTNKLITSYTLIAALSLALPVASFAAEKKAKPAADKTAEPAKPAAEKNAAIPYHGKVSAVDATAKTFTIKGKEKDRVFNLTDATKITKDSAPADINAITAEEEVRGQATKSGDKWDAVSVMIGPKPEGDKPAKKEAKAPKAAADPKK